MPSILNDIVLYTSMNTAGGIFNLGGAITTTRLLSQSLTGLACTGVTVNDAAMNVEGVGTLTYNPTSQTISWKAPGDTQTGTAVSIAANGQYEIRGFGATAGYLLITVVAASLPAVLTVNAITITIISNALCEDFSKAQALTGETDYHCFYVKNIGGSTIASLKLWINADTLGVDTLALWKSPAKNTTAESIVSDSTAPVGSAFTSPITESAGLELGPLNAADTYYVWLRRVLPITTTRVARDISSLRFAALI